MGFVVTGGGRGVGRAVVERLAGADDTVVVIEFDAGRRWPGWTVTPAMGGSCR